MSWCGREPHRRRFSVSPRRLGRRGVLRPYGLSVAYACVAPCWSRRRRNLLRAMIRDVVLRYAAAEREWKRSMSVVAQCRGSGQPMIGFWILAQSRSERCVTSGRWCVPDGAERVASVGRVRSVFPSDVERRTLAKSHCMAHGDGPGEGHRVHIRLLEHVSETSQSQYREHVRSNT